MDDKLIGKEEDTLPARYIDCGEVTRMPRRRCPWLGLQVMYDLIGDTRGTIYPVSGPRRENPTCCLYDLVFMMMYMGAVRALVERDLSRPMRGILGCVLDDV